MPMPFRLAVVALAAVSLCGCQESVSQTVFDAVGVTVPLTAGEARVYNGSYQGYIRRVVAKGPGCPNEPGERVIMVGDGVLWYAYSPVTFFTSPVQYDGKIDATSGDTHMVGQITGDQLHATVTSPMCETRINMHYVYNHGG